MSFVLFGHMTGSAGAVILLGAYFLLMKKKVSSETAGYHFFQFLGALGLILEAFATEAWAIFALEAAWIAIAVFGIIAAKRAAAPLPGSS